jgi:argininosuccinate lyase
MSETKTAAEAKLWGGRFTEATDTLVERLNASVTFDKRLWKHDIFGSLAHAEMLRKVGLLTAPEHQSISRGLVEIRAQVEAGAFQWRIDREDVHMNIEASLHERIGAAAGKLHTARSRNDQVALDARLWLREETLATCEAAAALIASLLSLAERNPNVLMPGYTHLQRAQPILAAHHFLAYVEMLERDVGRWLDGFARTNELPLGAGALAGTPHPIDRAYTAELLRFPRVSRNSLDAVSDRDFALEYLATSTIAQMHLSRLSEELVLWTSQEFGFIRLPDAFCTGSSIMPQKKNPDIPELVRGKTGRMTGSFVSLLTVLKGLPLAYNKDMQEDKEPLFDAVETIQACLTVTARMLERSELRPERMRRALDEGFLVATDLADALAQNGVPFRQAHRIVGELVAYCVERGVELGDVSADVLQERTGLLAEDVRPFLDPMRSVERRDVVGGPAPNRVAAELHHAHERVQSLRGKLSEQMRSIDLDHLLAYGA